MNISASKRPWTLKTHIYIIEMYKNGGREEKSKMAQGGRSEGGLFCNSG